MHIKFGGQGKRGAAGAATYHTQKKDSKGKVRDEVRVLRGNPDLTANVADSLRFERKYSLGLIMWSPDDDPSEDQIQEVLEEFEKTAFAGLNPEQYSFSATLHRENQGVHIHILSARVDLESGKSLNISPPGWQYTYDPLRDYFNEKYNWSKPDDPARARTVSKGHEHYKDVKAIFEGKNRTDAKTEIDNYIQDRITAGLIQTKDDVISSLAELGEITKISKNYVSVKPEKFNQAIRMKGALYGEQFSVESIQEIAREAGKRQPRSAQDNRRRIEQLYNEVERKRDKRARYNKEKYIQTKFDTDPISAKRVEGSDESRHPKFAIQFMPGFKTTNTKRIKQRNKQNDERNNKQKDEQNDEQNNERTNKLQYTELQNFYDDPGDDEYFINNGISHTGVKNDGNTNDAQNEFTEFNEELRGITAKYNERIAEIRNKGEKSNTRINREITKRRKSTFSKFIERIRETFGYTNRYAEQENKHFAALCERIEHTIGKSRSTNADINQTTQRFDRLFTKRNKRLLKEKINENREDRERLRL